MLASTDRANSHFWSRIGNALLFSISDAGVRLSQPQAVNGQNHNSQQTQQQRSVSKSASWGKKRRGPICRSRTRCKFT
jgi:type IV secretory pathway VirB10-like protein